MRCDAFFAPASPSPGPKGFAHAQGEVAAPGAIIAKICQSQIGVASSQAIEQKMLRHAEFESFRDEDSRAPGVLDANRVRRPRVERMGDGLAEKERRGAKDHQAAQLSAAKRTHLQRPGNHVASEHAARCVDAAVLAGVARTNVRVDFVMRRRKIQLSPSPECVAWKKKAILRRLHGGRGSGVLRPTDGGKKYGKRKNPQ